MIYRIEMDGESIFSYAKELTLLDPKLHSEINGAGSLEFTMPITHMMYDNPKILVSDVEVFENEESIWFGRVSEIDISMNKDKTVSCEGPYAFFNDSIQKPSSLNVTTLHALFRSIITEHNRQVSENRQFTIGTITVDDMDIEAEQTYTSTKNALDNECLEKGGGYFIFRKSENVNYIDWLSSLDEYGTQPVEFGVNLVDISQHFSGDVIYTSIIPLGKEVDGAKVTIESVNDGKDYIDTGLVDTYGRITKVVEFSEITDPAALLSASEAWLELQTIDPVRIECKAAEMHYLQPDSYSPFRLGQQTHVLSAPHGIDKLIPIVAMDIELDNPVKQASIGTIEKTNLTDYI